MALELALQGWNMDNSAQLPLLSPSKNTTEVAPEENGSLVHSQCSDGSSPEVGLLDIVGFSPGTCVSVIIQKPGHATEAPNLFSLPSLSTINSVNSLPKCLSHVDSFSATVV